MATEISVLITQGCVTTEVLDPAAVAPGAKSAKIVHSKFDVKIPLSGTTTPPVTIASHQTLALASGTIDLTALPTVQGTVSASGKKLRHLRINNRLGTHVFSIAVGAANGYVIGGNPIAVPAGGSVNLYFKDGLAAIDGTHKTLDYTFFAADQADVTLILG